MTHSTAPTSIPRRHRIVIVGAGAAHSTPAYAPSVRMSRPARRPDVLSGNEALFPDRRLAAAGARD